MSPSEKLFRKKKFENRQLHSMVRPTNLLKSVRKKTELFGNVLQTEGIGVLSFGQKRHKTELFKTNDIMI